MNNRKLIKTMIVDDEPLAIEGLLMRLSTFNNIEIIACCTDGETALEQIKQLSPELVFLDIQMPVINGFELINKLKEQNVKLPIIVFITAFNQFAVDAFDANAFDYLMKPVSKMRLDKCIERVEQQIADSLSLQSKNKLTSSELTNFLAESLAKEKESKSIITLKSGNEWVRLNIEQIFWIEAAGDYMCIHCDDGVHIIRKTMKQFELELSNFKFCRINRSVIVNLNKIKSASPTLLGDYKIELSEGQTLKVSRRYKEKVIKFLEGAQNSKPI